MKKDKNFLLQDENNSNKILRIAKDLITIKSFQEEEMEKNIV